MRRSRSTIPAPSTMQCGRWTARSSAAGRSGPAREDSGRGSEGQRGDQEAGLRSDGELVQGISDKVHEMLEAAIGRATSNGRSTVRPYDL